MKNWKIAVAATVLGCLAWGQALANGTLISVQSPKDMVYDSSRNVIYITSVDQVLRYGLDCGCMLTPIQITGAALQGIDLSRDGSTLAVADISNDGNDVWVDLIDPDTLSVTRVTTPKTFDEAGIVNVDFLADGSLVTTSDTAGSGWQPVRRLDLDTMTWSTLISQVFDGAVTSVSGDGKVFGYTDRGESSGQWGVYNSTSSSLYTGGVTQQNNYSIGTNADGSQFAVVGLNATYIYDASHQKVATIGNINSEPSGVVYDPTESMAYFAWYPNNPDIRLYDMDTFKQIGSLNVGYDIIGKMRISHDGMLLMANVVGGIWFTNLLSVSPVTASSGGERIHLTLPATGSPLRSDYGLASLPAHGQAFIQGDQLTYVPDPGFTGTDTFAYAAGFHGHTATATVTITVTADTSPYNPTVSFGTLPALQANTPIPGSSRVPGDFNGDGTSDMTWFDPDTSQFGYWTMSANANGTSSRTGTRVFNITSGYFIGAAGDLNGDGYTDLVFTSSNHDLWLWTNSRTGGFVSRQIYSYPADWQLIGAGDINGDGKDDLLWLSPSSCQFAYWLMDGGKRIGARVIPVTCGYYPTSIGYYTPTKRLSILWTSAAGDLYMWDAQANGGFRSYNLSTIYSQLGQGAADPRGRWAIGGGVAGQGIGIEWYDPASRTGFGATLSRSFNGNGVQTSVQSAITWSGSQGLLNPASGGYLIRGRGTSASALYVTDDSTLSTGTINGLQGGNAPRPDGAKQWTFPDGWRVVGAPANGAAPLPWH